MKKAELEKTITEINQKIESIETLSDKLSKANSVLESASQSVTDLEQRRSAIENFQKQISGIKEEVSQFKETVESVAKTADGYSETVEKQTEEYNNLKKQIEELVKQNKDLHETIKNQLGLVSTEILANAFFDESKKLKDSVKNWFWWLFGSIVALLLAVIWIAVWQVLEEKTLFDYSFLIRIPLISPLVYFVVFTAQQYGRDRKLLDEYIFKASVARSFEAYRKLIGEESDTSIEATKDKLQEKKLDFIISSIKGIYSSPMENIDKDKEGKNQIGIGILEKIASVFKKFEK